MATRKKVLRIANFGPIAEVEVPFADISVLVGPQATGKSLVLQWLKLAVDQNRVLGTLAEHGFSVRNDPETLAGRFFGRDYTQSITRATSVSFNGSRIEMESIAKRRARTEAPGALFVPAHRALVMGTGWPLLFREHGDDAPYVVREFSERVRNVLTSQEDPQVFSKRLRRFPGELRKKLDDALFHGGEVVVESEALGKKQLKLVHDRGRLRAARLSTMEWTTGQREVLPLLVGLYWALPTGAGARARARSLEWVIVEEPELGLHPDGVLAVMALLLEVTRRGYRLVISTHSQLVLDVLWSMQRLRGDREGDRKLVRILGLEETPVTRAFAQAVLRKSQSITYLGFDRSGWRTHHSVRSHDISNLDPDSPAEAEAQWGGLLGHSTRIADVVAGAS